MNAGFVEGMCLAATIAEDRDGGSAGPGLSARLREALEEALAAQRARDRGERRAEVARWAEALKRVDPETDLPPRALALVAGDAPPRVGRAWAKEAAPVRAGYAAGRGLRTTLRRLAGPSDPEAAAKEREAARSMPEPRRARWAPLASALGGDPERVLGALALGASGDLRGDACSRSWRRIGRALDEAEEAGWHG